MFNEGWEELAARPICTNCHARLDYGMQFFRGYPSAYSVSSHFVGGAANGEVGKLFGTAIDDPRGTAPLHAAGFAELATAQPEFVRCMTRNVVEYVFGPRTDPKVIDRLVTATDPRLRFRAVMRSAILEFLECDTCLPPQVAINQVPAAEPRNQLALAQLVDEHCTACHHEGAKIPSFERTLDGSTRAAIVDQVLFGRMPPSGALPAQIRHQFATAILADPSGATARLTGRDLLFGYADAPAALSFVVSREVTRRATGTETAVDGLNTLEVALDGRDAVVTPNFLLLTAIDAYQSCGEAPARAADCVDRALEMIWGIRSGAAPDEPR